MKFLAKVGAAAKRFVAAPSRPGDASKVPVKRKRTWKQRLKRVGIIVGVVVVLLAVVIPAGSFLWENHVADVNISAAEDQRKAGEKSTTKLQAVLADPGVKLFLTDPFFTDDPDWKAFTDQVHADDVITLAQVKTQLLATIDASTWPAVRDKVVAYSKTMTLSMDTTTRVRLYAAAAYVDVCKNHITDPTLPMFGRGAAGLGDKVIAVAKRYCR